MKIHRTELTVEELEQVSGGTFWPNSYHKNEYADAGIRVVDHFFACDEFWWNGKDIGHEDANAVVYFYQQKGRVPESVEEAHTIHPYTYVNGGNII